MKYHGNGKSLRWDRNCFDGIKGAKYRLKHSFNTIHDNPQSEFLPCSIPIDIRSSEHSQIHTNEHIVVHI